MRHLATLFAASAGFVAVLWLCGWLLRPDLQADLPSYSKEELAAAEKLRDNAVQGQPAAGVMTQWQLIARAFAKHRLAVASLHLLLVLYLLAVFVEIFAPYTPAWKEIVLSLLGWTQLARVVRRKVLSLREEDSAVAARLGGAGHGRVIFRHLVPGFTSHIIVALTLSVPGMILGETSLSFLGMGLRPPVVSWGVLLQDCMNLQAVGS
ncbi:MAG TPA: ABC transporter permease [Candidatus Handelsmanbacteria bacterium]|nr:ABC transporter permease [Candidatus Handelsmanbacteria bacterium]